MQLLHVHCSDYDWRFFVSKEDVDKPHRTLIPMRRQDGSRLCDDEPYPEGAVHVHRSYLERATITPA